MSVFLTEYFSGTPGTRLTAPPSTWLPRFGAGSGMVPGAAYDIASISGANRLRANLRYGDIFYINPALPPSADYSVSAEVRILSNVTSGNSGPGVLGRGTAGSTGDTFSCYSLAVEQLGGGSAQLRLRKVVAGVTTILDTAASFISTPGATHSIELRMQGASIKGYRNGVLEVTATDTGVSATGYAGVFPHYEATTDSIGYHVDNLAAAEITAPIPQDINVTPGKVNARASVPTFTSSVSNLNAVPAYASAYVSVPALVAEAYPLNVPAARVNARAGVPSLIGGATFFNAPAAYARALVAVPYLVSGQGRDVPSAYAEARTSIPVLIPGPVTIGLAPAYARVRAAPARVTMEIRLDPDAVFVEVHARRPTLKSRFSCGTIAPLQDRLRARVSQDGGTGCSVGVRGSDGFVKW